ncbi:MAG: acetyl-CoA carboxylase, biotin carboxyl carrier protein [bacterium]|nr:acetyl-CoA carboxylase, biotin carboxyl carrier protein [bacterium]
MVFLIDNEKENTMQNSEQVNEIFKIISSSGIVEFEWERGGKKIFIKRPEKITYAKKENLSSEIKTSVATPGVEDKIHLIKAPLVGTCYLVSGPEKKIMVKLGDKVKSGDKLCFVEAMKVFKEVVSDKDGEVKEILIENGQSVMYGQPLFKLTVI